MTERTFDWKPRFDERSKNFAAVNLLTVEQQEFKSELWPIAPNFLDQGSEGACVGFGCTNNMICKPGTARYWKNYTNEYAFDVYNEAKIIDEWEGEDYEGTSVLAGAKVLSSRGLIESYRWCFSLDEILITLAHTGPVVLGLNWYEGMFEPDSKNYIHPTGYLAGGHCILARGVNLRHKRVLLKNSWGKGWGFYGGCFISFDDLDILLHQYGEACVLIKQKIGA